VWEGLDYTDVAEKRGCLLVCGKEGALELMGECCSSAVVENVVGW